MKMKGSTAAILLVLSLVALVAGRLSAAVADDLPSHGLADEFDGGEEDASPWKCCDLPRCTRSIPPTCSCLDKVKKCAKTCKSCVKAKESNAASSRYVCLDTYNKPGPACPKTIAAGEKDASTP